ncbi:hypothetical protein [Arthrobacter crystallopoietes]|uniref:hypothetical protein n=1 Tax=Crystallibacter crystallopoietes TaxID=37928 RepID=UPI0011115747|nr:hypothetical protein [Arthrobacter crystallopoietes]
MNAPCDATIEVQVESRAAMDERINAAVEEMKGLALQCRTGGILVTRHEPGRFTVAISDSVPYGYTEQRDYRS